LISAIKAAAAKTRLKIPVLYGIDSIHGANYIREATLFPQPLGMAATWNPHLMLRGSQVTAAETRAAGIPWNFSPVLDIGRMPLWPRLYETLGEDVHLASVMGVATVRGYEGASLSAPTSVLSTMKHYVGYSFPTSGHDRTPALIPEITMREYFLPTFAAAAAAGSGSVMVNSGEVNGTPGHENRYLLREVLRGELGFQGLVVSDWEDLKKLVNIHRSAASEKDATRSAVVAGVDMSMVPSDYSFADLLLELAEKGEVPVARIDEAVREILRVKFALGLFENPGPPGSPAAVGSKDHRAVALEAARESITLLKNEGGVLPLRKGTRVLVVGPTADSLVPLNNGWTYTWQGGKDYLYPKDRPTIRAAIAAASPTRFIAGSGFEEPGNLKAASEAAASSDVIVACVGENTYTETPGNIDDLTLPESQLRLVEAMIATRKPVVLVLVEGRPRIISRIAEKVTAIVMAYNPGNEGGQAIADVLFGVVNPSGRLPFTYPRHANALLTYDHKSFEDQDTSFGLKGFRPQFEFGAGLSYTSFAYSDLSSSAPTIARDGTLEVTVKVRNAGKIAGKEVVQLYVTDVVASVTPPVRRLRRFAKVALQPGESRSLRFTLGPKDFSYIGTDRKPVIEPGEFVIAIGGVKAPLGIH
jgi:beta-glucosidase